MSNFYLMIQKIDGDFLTGMLPAVLCPNFIPRVDKTEYGIYPWYAMPKNRKPAFAPFPKQNLHLIMTSKKYKFDIRRIAEFYAFSPRFNECLSVLKTTLEDCSQVKLTDKDGNLLSEIDYYVGRFKNLPFEQAVDVKKSVYSHYGYLAKKKIDSIFILAELDYDLFLIDGLTASQRTFICSEHAVKIFKDGGIQGIDFIRTDQANWPLPDTSQLSTEEYFKHERDTLVLV